MTFFEFCAVGANARVRFRRPTLERGAPRVDVRDLFFSATSKRLFTAGERYAGLTAYCDDERDDDLECATLTVPVDYTDPDGDTVGIALLKLPATRPAERIGSLVVNPGGPGAPGTSYAAAAGVVFRPALYQRYDIVGFDPRGTGSSGRITSPRPFGTSSRT